MHPLPLRPSLHRSRPAFQLQLLHLAHKPLRLAGLNEVQVIYQYSISSLKPSYHSRQLPHLSLGESQQCLLAFFQSLRVLLSQRKRFRLSLCSLQPLMVHVIQCPFLLKKQLCSLFQGRFRYFLHQIRTLFLIPSSA